MCLIQLQMNRKLNSHWLRKNKGKARVSSAFRCGGQEIKVCLSPFLDSDFPWGGFILRQAIPIDGHSQYQPYNLFFNNPGGKRGPLDLQSFSALVGTHQVTCLSLNQSLRSEECQAPNGWTGSHDKEVASGSVSPQEDTDIQMTCPKEKKRINRKKRNW